jgi:NADPH:quinone reductase-like Zn-dependent oxidoreductase
VRAAIREQYGSPLDVVRVVERPEPELAPDRVLIDVAAAGLNSLDWRMATATPGLVRASEGFRAPRDPRLGEDVAGTVLAVGSDVTRFAPGDRVFGQARGAFAERVAAREKHLALVPDTVALEDAAALTIAGVTAIQAIALGPTLGAGSRVLVIGAAGGVGTYCVQLAASLGAEVTGVSSAAKADFVREQGATRVIDYTTERITGSYDLIVELAVNAPLKQTAALLTPTGVLVLSSGDGDRLLGPLPRIAAGAFSRRIRMLSAQTTTEGMLELARLAGTGALRPVVTDRYPLARAAEAIAHLQRGHTLGKILLVPERD